ncbi:hypothetical protein V2I01_07140 [Micromonospora sp. BRA006-A]|nr:hypothetical protein [Micromonospora sp. BRA006-A]
MLEAYTLPAAALALGAGLLALRRRPGLTSWPALGPGLGAAFLPSLVSVLVSGEPQPWRRLALGAAALAVVLGGRPGAGRRLWCWARPRWCRWRCTSWPGAGTCRPAGSSWEWVGCC